MISGKTKDGFEFNVTDAALDDWELLETLTEIDAGDVTKIVKAFPMLLGNEQFSMLKKHMKETNGRVSTQEMISTFKEIMDASQNTKK